MSEKVKLSIVEWAAILLVAFFVPAFLTVGVVQNFVESYWQHTAGGNHAEKTQGIQGWITVGVGVLTLFVLFFQSWIYHGQRSLMKEQSAISLRQVTLEERRFVLEHRPRIVMTQAWLYESDKGLHVHFVIKNIGTTDAVVGLVNLAFEVMIFGSKDPRAMQAETAHINVMRTLDQGNVFGDHYLFSEVGLSYSQRDEKSRCAFSGQISYKSPGDQTFKYELGFYRELHGRNPTFRSSENPAREYSY